MNKADIQSTENKEVQIPRQKCSQGHAKEQGERNCWEKNYVQNSQGLQIKQGVK